MAAERAGIATGELDPPAIPAGSDVLISLYWQLRRAAGSNGLSANAIAFSEILAWQKLSGVELTPDEVDVLFEMDAAALAAFAEGS
jgi:hypothetical protein